MQVPSAEEIKWLGRMIENVEGMIEEIEELKKKQRQTIEEIDKIRNFL